MAERVPTSPPFDTTALSDALHTDPRDTLDLAFGPGKRYDLAGKQSSLEVFPEAHMSRITTPTSRLELFGSPMPQVIDGNVVFSRETGHEDTSLSVSPEGIVVFGYVSSPQTPKQPAPAASDVATAPEQLQESPLAAPADDAPTAELTPPAAHSSPARIHRPRESADPQHRPAAGGSPPDTSPAVVPVTAAGNTVPTSDRRPAERQTPEQPRLQLTGRLGRDPSFRTSPRGTFIGRFPLAVHQQDGTTSWHTILAFGERAKQLQHRAEAGELTKGQEVSLVGYQHTRTQPTRDGESKTVTEIYAVAVTRR